MPLLSAKVAEKFNEREAAKQSGGNALYLNPGDISEEKGARVTPLGDDSVTGFHVWIGNSKPRTKLVFADEPTRDDIAQRCDDVGIACTGKERITQFFGFFVWNYETETVQYFEFSQVALTKGIVELLSDEEIAEEPGNFDWKIKVDRSTEFPTYSVMGVPGFRRKEPHASQIAKAWEAVEAKNPNLQVALMGGDVFTGTVKACPF